MQADMMCTDAEPDTLPWQNCRTLDCWLAAKACCMVPVQHNMYALQPGEIVFMQSATSSEWDLCCRCTCIPRGQQEAFLRELQMEYTTEAYSLFHHNCNHFTNDFAIFLTGSGIPVCILLGPACQAAAL